MSKKKYIQVIVTSYNSNSSRSQQETNASKPQRLETLYSSQKKSVEESTDQWKKKTHQH